MDADGRFPHRITALHLDIWSGGLAWSPDGRTLAFTIKSEMYFMAPDGSDLHRVFPPYTINLHPAWSPDGSHIAYECGLIGICTARTDGTGVRIVARDGLGGVGAPVWSPDGRQLAYLRSSGPDPGKSRIAIMNADGTHKRQIPGAYDGIGTIDWG
jgi:Tol biopolymer transport system component